jgi:hypothetical protein
VSHASVDDETGHNFGDNSIDSICTNSISRGNCNDSISHSHSDLGDSIGRVSSNLTTA